MPAHPVDLAMLRQPLAHSQTFWRSLEELAATPDGQALLQDKWPHPALAWHDPVSRRQVLRLMGASLALAGLGACTRQPEEKIVPYVQAPEGIVAGQPQFFATALPLDGLATGVLVKSHMGRPIKVEGNPEHPASLGATDAFAQAAVLGLYDPDRSQALTHVGQISTLSAFLTTMSTALETQRLKRGAGLRVLTESVTSPTLAQQFDALFRLFPLAVWHQYQPVTQDAVHSGTRLVFGEARQPLYHFSRAEVILALDADMLASGPGSLRYARDFMDQRRLRDGQGTMNRLYVVESTPTLTGALADHRLPLRPSAMAGFAQAVAQPLGALTADSPLSLAARLTPEQTRWTRAVADDLQQHRGTSLVLAGAQQPPLVQALAQAMNYALGNIGQTVTYTAPVQAHPVNHLESLAALGRDMAAGKVELLVILGGNPVYTAPADLRFAEAMAHVPLRIHLGLYEDETSALCHWHVPEAHALEVWSDARAYDGTVTIMQPLIAPLYGGKSAHEMLATLMGQADRSGYSIVREYWQNQYPEADFERLWHTVLHDGTVAGTTLPSQPVAMVQWHLDDSALPPALPAPEAAALDIAFRPDPTVWDGRFSNNGWLQELPKPLTKLTWDNAALCSPATARRLGVRTGDVVDMQYQGRSVRAPVWIMPGQADDTVTLHLGYGRWRAGRVGTGAGVNAYALQTAAAPWFDTGVSLRPTGDRATLATTQQHHSMEGRDLVRVATLQQAVAHPQAAHERGHAAGELTLYPPYPYDGYAWGMAIDLNACTGCNACVTACQAENNIPVVGKEQVARGREMHWLRLDRYYSGDLHNPQTYHQPILCMHCENAPCEVVCPVGATAHSDEGLNDMVYNRCVGTRYCSNNCPYKVRRFNFLQYADLTTPSLKLLRNPEVTVRTRGVMEKCTYCVQRINTARIQAKKDERPLRDGEVVTACQAACPTQAMVFGNINDPHSRVARLKADPRHYGLLTELNTRPRTTYLARLRNPNPALPEPG